MPFEINMGLFLQNVRVALSNQQYHYATFLLDFALKLAEHSSYPPAFFPLDISIGLHPGRIRTENEDCLLALQGAFSGTQERMGLFIVADGMGGHARGQEAAHLAIQTILEYVSPFLIEYGSSNWGAVLAEGIQQANRVIHGRNQLLLEQLTSNNGSRSHSQGIATTSQIAGMGTTVTAFLLIGETAYIANVGDSRTYLYDQSLRKVTKDHSVVAQLLANGLISDEEIYIHPKRHQITRSLGGNASVQVDSFVGPLNGNEVLLLCSDGLWEATRNREIEKILATSWANANAMVNQLVQLANAAGGTDNIGCIVIQLQKRPDISTMETASIDTVEVLARRTSSSSLS